MDQFDKVEKLRSRASVTYEEARDALEQANGDLLDAMVILEKQGKTTKPSVSTYRTTYEEQTGYERVDRDTIEEEDAGRRFRDSLKNFIHVIWRKLLDNSISVRNRQGEEAVKFPLLVPVILLIVGWYAFIPIMIVMLFFGFRYKIVGRDEMPNANDILNRAGDMADAAKEQMKQEWKKGS